MITYIKLKNGDWGLRSDSALASGVAVSVVKKSKERKLEIVGDLVWKGLDIWLYAIKKAPPTSSSGSFRRSGRCRGCRGPIEDAPHHRAMGGYCGQCAFDEFDC